jgi:hypothetical protein
MGSRAKLGTKEGGKLNQASRLECSGAECGRGLADILAIIVTSGLSRLTNEMEIIQATVSARSCSSFEGTGAFWRADNCGSMADAISK